MINILKPLDIVIALKLVALNNQDWTFKSLSTSLYISSSTAHQSLCRLSKSLLIGPFTLKPRKRALEEFLIHGVKYAYPPILGGPTRGILTRYAASPLNIEIIQSTEWPPVWPYEHGNVRGYEFSPLHKCVPKAVENDTDLYELLTLVDAIRGGMARESGIAIQILKERLT